MPQDANESLETQLNAHNHADIPAEGASRAIECRPAQMNASSHHCPTFSANDCASSPNEQQKVYNASSGFGLWAKTLRGQLRGGFYNASSGFGEAKTLRGQLKISGAQLLTYFIN